MYKDTGYKTELDWRCACLTSNLGSIVDSLIDFENFVDFQFDVETDSVINRTLHLYLNDAFACVSTCQDLFSMLLKNIKEVSDEA